jgi:hypothetical protein
MHPFPKGFTMNTEPALDRYTLKELNRLHDEARERAQRLRSETMNAFWDGIVDLLSAQRLGARRAAERFERRLDRHRRQRAAAGSPPSTASC